MKRTLMVLITALALGISGLAAAADAPDCSEKQKAVDDAKAEGKAAKADLSGCKEMKGKEKKECEKPLKAAAKDAKKAAKDKGKEASKALACCKNPKKKGC
jgi:hypothetical protein